MRLFFRPLESRRNLLVRAAALWNFGFGRPRSSEVGWSRERQSVAAYDRLLALSFAWLGCEQVVESNFSLRLFSFFFGGI